MNIESSFVTGLFTLAGAVIGLFASYLTTRLERRWEKARKLILDLSEQVAAYHKLEELYIERLSRIDHSATKKLTIMKEMREQVAEIDGYVRPKMTANESQIIRRDWL
jgi:hypothetical protein